MVEWTVTTSLTLSIADVDVLKVLGIYLIVNLLGAIWLINWLLGLANNWVLFVMLRNTYLGQSGLT